MFNQRANTVYPSDQELYYKNHVVEVHSYRINRLEPLPAIAVQPPPPYSEHDVYNNLPQQQVDPEGFTATFSVKEVRKAFIKKVYAILCIQLLITSVIVCLFTFVPEIRDFFQARFYITLIAGLVVIILFIAVGYNKKVQRNYPRNIIALGILTLAMAFFAGCLASTIKTEAVLIAFGITASVCLLVTFVTITTRLDFTSCWGFVFVVVIILLCFVFLSIATYTYSWYIHVVFGCLVALLFSLFLAYDTRRIVKNEDDAYSPEDYTEACIEIYTDVIMMFVILVVCIAAGGGGGQ